MSEEIMDQEDRQVIDMVNAKSEAPTVAGRIQGAMDAEKVVTQEIAKMRVMEATRRRKRQNILSVVGIVLCAVVAAALLLVLAKPQWIVWLVNAGVATCCTAAGIVADRLIRRNSKWQQ